MFLSSKRPACCPQPLRRPLPHWLYLWPRPLPGASESDWPFDGKIPGHDRFIVCSRPSRGAAPSGWPVFGGCSASAVPGWLGSAARSCGASFAPASRWPPPGARAAPSSRWIARSGERRLRLATPSSARLLGSPPCRCPASRLPLRFDWPRLPRPDPALNSDWPDSGGP